MKLRWLGCLLWSWWGKMGNREEMCGEKKNFCKILCRCGENVGKTEEWKIAKSFNFKGLAIVFESNSYPEPIIYPANNNSQEKLTTKKTSMLSCLYFHLISKKKTLFWQKLLIGCLLSENKVSSLQPRETKSKTIWQQKRLTGLTTLT